MAGINKVIVLGRLGRDPETKFTNDGNAVCNFSVATSESWTDKSGHKKESTEWHKIVCFGKMAENCEKHLSKGSQVYVEGRLKTRSWEKDGVTRYTTEIQASEVQFLSPKTDSAGHDTRPTEYARKSKQEAGGAPVDDDVPF